MVPGYLAFQGVTDGLPNLVKSMFVTFAEEETSPCGVSSGFQERG